MGLEYSGCCKAPVLSDGPRLYCYKCNKTILNFLPRYLPRRVAELTMDFTRGFVRLMFRGRTIAYVRDVPNYVHVQGGYRKAGPSEWKWFVQGSAIAQAFGLEQCKGEDGFKSKRAAYRAFLRYLLARVPNFAGKAEVAP